MLLKILFIIFGTYEAESQHYPKLTFWPEWKQILEKTLGDLYRKENGTNILET